MILASALASLAALQ